MDLPLISPPRRLYWPEVVYQIQEILNYDPDVYLVGGMVRDAYRDYPFKDIDLAYRGDGRKLAKKIANTLGGKYYELDDQFQVGRALLEWKGEPYIVDVASLRGQDITTDLQARDFTINALCVPLAIDDLQGIYDPLEGITDWNNKVLRQCSYTSISDDPLRALRAVRQSLAFGLKLDPATKEAIKAAAPHLNKASVERQRDELFAMLGGKKPKTALMVLHHVGLLTVLIPTLASVTPAMWPDKWLFLEKLEGLLTTISPRRDDNVAANAEFGTLVYMLDRHRGVFQDSLHETYANNRQGDQIILLAGLLLGLGESMPQNAKLAEGVAIDLHLTVEEQRRLAGAIAYAERPLVLYQNGPASEADLYQYWVKTQHSGLDAILLGLVWYIVAQGANFRVQQWTEFLLTIQHLLAWQHKAANASALVTGDELMSHFQLPQGKIVGQLLAYLRQANALNEIATPEAALALADSWLQSSED